MLTRKCSLCKKKIPAAGAVIGSLKAFCNMEHLIEYSRSAAGRNTVNKARVQQVKQFKASDRALQLRLTQTEFNRLIRLLDTKQGCISCTQSANWNGQWHASHYRSVGAQSSLRFNPLNVHKACSICNNHLSGNIRGYREGLLRFYGQPILDYLEVDRSPIKWAVSELVKMRQEFSAEIRLLLAGSPPSRNWRAYDKD